MRTIDWNPADGDLCQGDVVLFRVPDSVRIDASEEIAARDGRLILAEGEQTGHHHAIWNPQPALFRDDGMARELMAQAPAEPQAGTARLYRDPKAVDHLIQLGELDHNRLAIGLLVVEGGPVVLRHDEHDAVRIPPGRFYVGGQNEWDAAEERRVAD